MNVPNCEMGFGNWPVAQIENVFFHLSDGNKLAMKLWLPCLIDRVKTSYSSLINDSLEKLFVKQIYDGKGISEEKQFPVIMEYLPYCKDSFITLLRDYARSPWFTSHGFIVIRVDIRGTGISSGYYYDEYDQQEFDDCVELINWLASQPWCNGRVGMYGKSWGGFNGLQLAYLQPQPLKAVVSLYSSDNRFTDDIHYEGGAMIGNGMLSWSAFMTTNNSKPPHPRYFDDFDSWKKFWLDRLEKSTYSCAVSWLSHQHHDDIYWKHGSICTDYSRIECPVLIIGGLADSYTNSAFRMAAKLNSKSRAVIGPWDHNWPDVSVKGPNIDYLNLCLKWYNKHLKGDSDDEHDDSPRLSLFLRGGLKIGDENIGRWYNIDNWNSLYQQYKQIAASYKVATSVESKYISKIFFNQEYSLSREMNFVEPVELKPHALQGAHAGLWLGYHYGFPEDQLVPNTHSLTWISDEFKEDTIFLAFSKAFLHIKALQKGRYTLAIRLCDQFPSGECELITRGCINLNTLKNGWCSYFEPNKDTIVGIELNAATYVMKSGHKLMIAVSPTCFPLVYPSVNNSGLIFNPTNSFLMYQTVPDIKSYNEIFFEKPMPLLQLPVTLFDKGSFDYETREENKVFVTELNEERGKEYFPDYDYQAEFKVKERYTTDRDVTYGNIDITTQGNYEFSRAFSSDDKIKTEIETTHKLSSDKQHFHLTEDIKVILNGEVFFSKIMNNDIPRKYV